MLNFVSDRTLATGSGYDRPFSRCSLRTVRTALFRLTQVIKPLRVNVTGTNTGTIGTWHQIIYPEHEIINPEGEKDILPFNLPFNRDPYRKSYNPTRDYWDHWYVSLSYWLFAFNTGLYYKTASDAASQTPSIFTPAMQAAALTDGTLTFPGASNNFYIRGSDNQGILWSSIVSYRTVLMTLSQSLDTLLELPEPRMGILCANYIKKLEGLLSDVMDYNVDLKKESKDGITYYVRSKIQVIAEFTSQELESLDGLSVGKIALDNDAIIVNYCKVYNPVSLGNTRFFEVPDHLRGIISKWQI